MMKAEYKRLGDYIVAVDERNSDLSITLSQGINNNKYFQQPRQVAENSSNDKIVRRGYFAYNRATTRNGDKISIAYREGEDCTVSAAYQVFFIKNEDLLNPHYLLLWFKRPTFDRYARFKSHGSAHEFFEWDDMCNVMLPVPSIEEQRRIVAQYQTVENRIKNNERLIALLEDTAQTIFRHRFIDNIDTNNLPEGWRMGTLSDIAEYCSDRIDTAELNSSTYISTENMLKDRGGIKEAESVPSGKCIKFHTDDILISNIRPYFKKIWRSTFDGGCSADVLCIRTKSGFYPEYTYSIVEREHYFDYVTAGSKGTKMPRGDREWNMKYEIPIPSSKDMDEFHREVKQVRNYIDNLRRECSLLSEVKEVLTNSL